MENQIDVECCTTAVKNIESLINKMQNCISSLQDDTDGINRAWTSDNATAFRNKVDTIIENLRSLKTSITNINNAVERTKQEIVKVDATATN